MRKLLIILNAMLKSRQPWRSSAVTGDVSAIAAA
jgi:hypothetical protein